MKRVLVATLSAVTALAVAGTVAILDATPAAPSSTGQVKVVGTYKQTDPVTSSGTEGATPADDSAWVDIPGLTTGFLLGDTDKIVVDAQVPAVCVNSGTDSYARIVVDGVPQQSAPLSPPPNASRFNSVTNAAMKAWTSLTPGGHVVKVQVFVRFFQLVIGTQTFGASCTIPDPNSGLTSNSVMTITVVD